MSLNNKTRRERRRKMLLAAVAGGVLALLYIAWPHPFPMDYFDEYDTRVSAWVRDKVLPWEKAAETESLHALAESKKAAIATELAALHRLSETDAARCVQQLGEMSGQSFGSQESVAALNAKAEAELQHLEELREQAEQRAEAVRTNVARLRALAAAPQTDETSERAFAATEELAKHRETLLFHARSLSQQLGTLEADARSSWEETVTPMLARRRKEIAAYTVRLQQPLEISDLNGLDAAEQEAAAICAAFPTASYEPAVFDPAKAPLTHLRCGDASLSLAAEGDLGETLVRPLVLAWMHSLKLSQKGAVKVADNGVRYEVTTPQGDTRTIDVIQVAAGDETAGAHAVFSLARPTRSEQLDKLCSDALVFTADGKKTLTAAELSDTPKHCADDAARSAFALYGSSLGSLSESGPLAVSLFHAARPQGGQAVAVSYPGNRAYAPDPINIASGQYRYGLDVLCRMAEPAAGWSGDAFRSFVFGDEAQKVAESCSYVPLYQIACPEPVRLDERRLPVQRILKRLHGEGFEDVAARMGYGKTENYLRGVQLPYPIFFPTAEDKEMVLDNASDSMVLNRTLHHHLAQLAKRYGCVMVVVTGHADERGSAELNTALSRGRAENFLKQVLRPAAGGLLNGTPKPSRDRDGVTYTTPQGLWVSSMGCAADYSLCPPAPAGMQDKALLDEHYRADRRAAVYVIVPREETKQ